jgi:hypothetical protein
MAISFSSIHQGTGTLDPVYSLQGGDIQYPAPRGVAGSSHTECGSGPAQQKQPSPVNNFFKKNDLQLPYQLFLGK